MKILISVDNEGISGIANMNELWMRETVTQDTNAAIEGALEGGATEIVVVDSHGSTKDNILWPNLHPKATLIRGGSNTPLYFLEGLDESIDAVFLIGWHDKSGGEGTLAHCFFQHPFIKINGEVVGEGQIAAGVAGIFGVPIALISGDDIFCGDLKSFLGNVETAVVKRAIDYSSAECFSREKTVSILKKSAKKSLSSIKQFNPYQFKNPISLEVECVMHSQATLLARIPGVRKKGRSVHFRSNNFREVFDIIILIRFMMKVGDQFYGNLDLHKGDR